MAEIHKTTLSPTKLELLTTWLPDQPWYVGAAKPELTKVGGFRLDDPAGEVGIELIFVTDTSDSTPVTYHVPMSYRGAPLDGAGSALIGSGEHGVLGRRWVYDGERDPVVLAQLAALLRGEVQAQQQSVSFTPDLSVTVHTDQAGPGRVTEVVRVLREGNADGGHVDADWTLPDGRTARGPVALLR
jgi:Maltokinase N-terminal cap domain